MSTIDLYDNHPSAARNPTVLAGLKRLWASYKRIRAEHRAATALSELDDHLLRDIGVERQDVIAALRGARAPSILFNPMRRTGDHE